jgi:long-chain fatty acid transport protein
VQRAFAIALLFAAESAALADSDTHYADTIVGERASGMGGAFTALANEATGAYYNPAGIVVEESALIQLSMSAYKLRKKRVRVVDLCGTVFEDDRSAAFSFPASLGFVKQLSAGDVRHAFGITLAVPYADRSGQGLVERDKSCGEASLDVGVAGAVVDRVLRGGVTYAISPVPWLKLGATAGLSVRGLSTTLLASVLERSATSAGTHPSVSFVNIDVNLWSAFGELGAIAEVVPGLFVGVSATSPLVPLSRHGVLDLAQASGAAGDPESARIRPLNDAKYSWKQPLSGAIGVAWSRPKSLTLSVDVKLYGGIDRYPIVTHEQLEGRVPHNTRDPVLNLAAGAELWLAEDWIVRLGLFTNHSAYPTPDPELASDHDRVDLYGGTIGISWASDASSLLSLALQGQIGRGEVLTQELRFDESEGAIVGTQRLGDVEEQFVLVTFGGSFDID